MRNSLIKSACTRKITMPFLLLAVSFLIVGCVKPQPKVYTNKYDSELTKALISKVGANVIDGNAFLRQRGGGIITCAGHEVYLTPNTPYANEYIVYTYSKDGWLFGEYINGKGYKQSGDYILAPSRTDAKITVCDSSGKFKFENIGDGEYFVITKVLWSVPTQYGLSTQGGNLVQLVKLSNGETKNIVMSH